MNIEQGIPIPPAKRGRKVTPLGIAVRALKIGESFVCSTRDAKMAQALSGEIGFSLTIRKVSEGQHRVWRIK